MNNHTLGDIVREARLAKEQSLRQVSKLLEITPSYMSDIENDRRVPSEEVLQRRSLYEKAAGCRSALPANQ
jgi:ribosome-binding protein aMBF1 (putative translation factor)